MRKHNNAKHESSSYSNFNSTKWSKLPPYISILYCISTNMHTHMKPEGIAFLGMKAGLLAHETEVYSNAGTQQKNSWKQTKCTLHIKIPSEECKKY